MTFQAEGTAEGAEVSAAQAVAMRSQASVRTSVDDGGFYLLVNCRGTIGQLTPDGSRIENDEDFADRPGHRLHPRHRQGAGQGPAGGRLHSRPQRTEHHRPAGDRYRARDLVREPGTHGRLRRDGLGGRHRGHRPYRGRDRTDRHPGEQHGSPTPQPVPGVHRRRLAPPPRHQPHQRLPRGTRGRTAHGAPRPGQDRQHLLAAERSGPARYRRLLRHQGRPEDAHQGNVRRPGPAGHPGQRHRTRLLRHRTHLGPGGRRRVQRLGPRPHTGRPPGRRRRPLRSLCWPRGCPSTRS